MKRTKIYQGDFVLVSLREYQDNTGDIIHKYFPDEVASLKAYGEIQKTDVELEEIDFDFISEI